MEHIEKVCSLGHNLFLISICSIKILSILKVIAKRNFKNRKVRTPDKNPDKYNINATSWAKHSEPKSRRFITYRTFLSNSEQKSFLADLQKLKLYTKRLYRIKLLLIMSIAFLQKYRWKNLTRFGRRYDSKGFTETEEPVP